MPALDSITLGVQHTCLSLGHGAELRVTVRSTSSLDGDPSVSCTVSGPDGVVLADTGAGFSNTFRFSPVADGEYTIEASDYAGKRASRTYTISCGAAGPAEPAPGTCDLALSGLQVMPSTTRASVEVTASTTAAWVKATLVAADGTPLSDYPAGTPAGQLLFILVPEGTHTLTVEDSRGCKVTEQVVVELVPVQPPTPAPEPAPAFYAVGGRLPRPALLDTPVTALLTPEGQPRPGLHVQVELLRVGALAPFARLRKTVRREAEQVDVAADLAVELLPQITYPPGLPAVYDSAATLPFAYRWREVDANSAGNWQEGPGRHYALLSAPAPNTPTGRYLAGQPTAAPLSAFPSGQLVQAVGLPLDVAVWLPERAPGSTWFAEWRYLDGLGQEVEIRAVPLPDYLPAGVTRLSLPRDLLACAARAVLTLCDTDRSYAGTCQGGVVVPPDPGTGGHDFKIPDFSDPDFL
ncbi:hypothetical protein [Hymenobacter pini]|uniref:hypothetical protein n=1 Tax=Hymenobacter pini TaxID=2880879 RepID=UPI001CF4E357|nr:hypothetical protein [Hymenobacter pini]MCA8830290.1 hypothetical protein [Hymenobacter pini]